DVEEKDARVEGHAQFGVGLADAGKDDVVAAAPRGDGAIQLAAGGDVEAGTMFAEQLANVQVAVGLDAVADEGRYLGERFLDLPEVVQERRLAVDEEGSAVGLGQFGDRDILAVQNALVVAKVVHGGSGCFSWVLS